LDNISRDGLYNFLKIENKLHYGIPDKSPKLAADSVLGNKIRPEIHKRQYELGLPV